ncbi:MAG: mechanosensitive ion channel [Minwuia sp.]|nr:mechanosensitive ion channel [Minwuia sp.]
MDFSVIISEVRDWISRLLSAEGSLGDTLLSPWNLYQVAILVGLIALAHLLSRLIAPFVETAGQMGPRRVSALSSALVHRKRSILLAILLWLTVLTMQEVTWPSRSFYLAIAANLVTAWVIISLLTRLISNRLLGRTIALIIWAVAALNITGVLPAVIAALEASTFGIGERQVSLLAIVNGMIIALALIWAAIMISRLVEQRIFATPDLAPATQVLLSKLLRIVLLTGAVFFALDLTGIDLTALAVFSGAVGLGVGFGLQKVVSNLISGFILLTDKSIKPGDVITVDETYGWINKLNARYVSVVTRDGREFLIPNEDLITNQVINWSYSDKQIRLEIKFGVAYDSDPHLVREIAVEAAMSADRVLPDPKPVCHLVEFGDSSIDFVLRFWIIDPAEGVVNIKGKVFLALWDTLKEHDVKIPFPHREVILREPPRAGKPPET